MSAQLVNWDFRFGHPGTVRVLKSAARMQSLRSPLTIDAPCAPVSVAECRLIAAFRLAGGLFADTAASSSLFSNPASLVCRIPSLVTRLAQAAPRSAPADLAVRANENIAVIEALINAGADVPKSEAYLWIVNKDFESTKDAERINRSLRHLAMLDNADWQPKAATAMNSRVGRLGGHSHDSRNLTFLFRSREATTHRVYLNEVDTPP